MKKKSKIVREESLSLQSRLEEVNQLLEEALAEEKEKEETLSATLTDLCEEQGYFCGVVLTPEDVATVVALAIQSKENIRIPFRLYSKD